MIVRRFIQNLVLLIGLAVGFYTKNLLVGIGLIFGLMIVSACFLGLINSIVRYRILKG